MSNKETFELFPILITKHSSVLSEEQCASIYNYCLNKKYNQHAAIIGEGVSSHSFESDILLDIAKNIVGCENLYRNIHDLITAYTKEINIKPVSITNSWFNIQNNSILSQHFHPVSIVSAAIYINVDNDSSKLYFENPNNLIKYLNSNFTTNELSYNKFNYETFSITPKIGDIIIFPSYIVHGSSNNINKTKNRMVISLNAI